MGDNLPNDYITSRKDEESGNLPYHGHKESEKVVGPALGLVKLPSSIKNPSPRKASRSSDTYHLSDREKTVIRPVLSMTSLQMKTRLVQRLRKRFHDPDSTFVTNPLIAASTLVGAVDPFGIHIFVDFSNIHIGFQSHMRAARGLHEKAYVRLILFSHPYFTKSEAPLAPVKTEQMRSWISLSLLNLQTPFRTNTSPVDLTTSFFLSFSRSYSRKRSPSGTTNLGRVLFTTKW